MKLWSRGLRLVRNGIMLALSAGLLAKQAAASGVDLRVKLAVKGCDKDVALQLPVQISCAWEAAVVTSGSPWNSTGSRVKAYLAIGDLLLGKDYIVDIPDGIWTSANYPKGVLSYNWAPSVADGNRTFNIECHILADSGSTLAQEDQYNPNNDLASVQCTPFYVAPLTLEQIPVPLITGPLAPPGEQVVHLTYPTPLTLSAVIPDPNPKTKISDDGKYKYDVLPFWGLATQAYEEDWHFRLLKRKPNGIFAQVSQYDGETKSKAYSFLIPYSEATKLGDGIYRVDTWLSQKTPGGVPLDDYSNKKTPGGVTNGQEASVTFELSTAPPNLEAEPVVRLPRAAQEIGKQSGTASAHAVPLVTAPQLSVLTGAGQVQSNCNTPQPAFIATVQIKNSGGALPGNQGSISIQESGANPSLTGSIALPAIAAGEAKFVAVPVIGKGSYTSLAGTHQFLVYLNVNPAGVSALRTNPAYQFQMVFPAGYCQGRR